MKREDTPGRNTKRNEKGLFESSYSTADILAVVEDGDLTGTQDVADALGSSYETAYKRLQNLEEEGRVQSGKVANTLIWELADAREDEPDADTDADSENESETDSMPTVEDGLNPDAVTKDYVGDE
jgi:hypothetical protein